MACVSKYKYMECCSSFVETRSVCFDFNSSNEEIVISHGLNVANMYIITIYDNDGQEIHKQAKISISGILIKTKVQTGEHSIALVNDARYDKFSNEPWTISTPPDISPIFIKLDIMAAIDVAMISVIISFLFVNLFDTAGTLLGVASRAKLIETSGKIKNLDKALKADSTASVAGSFFGCSPVTSYVESSAGVEAGGRTGLTAIVVGVFFLIAIFFSPLASMVPGYATAGALIYVAILMLGGMEKLDWSDNTELLPALIMIIMIPLTFSIANGIAIGFISYVILKYAGGKKSDISIGAWFLFIIFLLKFIILD